MLPHTILSDPRILGLILLLVSTAKCASIEGTNAESLQDDSQLSQNDWTLPQMMQQENDKRNSWNKFRGSWGKREDTLNDLQDESNQYDQLKRGKWSNLHDESNQYDQLKRGKWSNLHGTWGKRLYGGMNDGYYLDDSMSLQDVLSQLQGLNAVPEKREWTKFTGTWGKRPFASRTVSPRSTNWSSLRGSWGKRDGWAQLRGVWGKKADEMF